MTPSQANQSWSDDQLIEAIEKSTSWRAVARELGLKSNSAGTVRIIRRRAEQLGADTSHFRGARGWSDAQLREALTSACSWDEAITTLGLSSHSGNIRPFLKGHAIRLGIDCGHLASRRVSAPAAQDRPYPQPDLERLRTAGESIAAAWFTLSGCAVSVPVETAVYDLLAELPDGIKRVQVKTTIFNSKNGWQVNVGHKPHDGNGSRRLTPYTPDAIDLFFIFDGDLTMYLIPANALAGATRVLLRTYQHYAIGSACGFMLPECQSS
ncbi:MAG: group I intron-associated PD-(D/E)XK endonuclease [Streptosporangiales bacterium]|nr:group I intron-associated PD-(D/E)XK endonuclease [Streptosporangiales bacterium]